MTILRRFVPLFACLAGLGASAAARGAGAPRHLRVEYLENPSCVAESAPRFSWELDDARRGATQTAYELEVTPEFPTAQTVKWSSGKVTSRATCHVEFSGPALAAGTAYLWRVRAFDADDQPSAWSELATFRMALADNEWAAGGKAQWITDSAPPPIGAPASFGWRTHARAAADDLQWIQVDFGEPQAIDEIRMHAAREGASAFPVQFRVWMADEPTFASTSPIHVVDETGRDVADPGDKPLVFALNGRPKARCFRLGVLELRSAGQGVFAAALSELEFVERGRIVSRGAVVTCSDSVEENGWSMRNLCDGVIGSRAAVEGSTAPALRMRREFDVTNAAPWSATAYVSARGVYTLRVNGRAVGSDVLAPGWTDYRTSITYQAYDVTALLNPGRNAIAIEVGDGWYAGDAGFGDTFAGVPLRGVYGARTSAIAQIVVREPGDTRVLVASDATWKCSTDGPVRTNDLVAGETQDARRETAGWDRVGFDDGTWRQATVSTDVAPKLVPQSTEPVRVRGAVAAVSVAQPEPGVFVFDFGRVLIGWCRLTCSGESGANVVLRHAQALDASGKLDTRNLGRAAQTDHFTLRGGGRETCEPRFTSHSFRYVEVRGAKPVLADIVAIEIGSAARETATFACSEPVLDGLWRNALATQRAHLGSVFVAGSGGPERTGDLFDLDACARSALYALDLGAFVGKWTADVRAARASDGRFRDVAPHACTPDMWLNGSPGACDAAVNVPWAAFVEYGDRRLLERHVDAMSTNVDELLNRNRDFVWKYSRGPDPGERAGGGTIRAQDWSTAGCDVPPDVFATLQLWRTTGTLVRVRESLGRELIPGPAYRGAPAGSTDYRALLDRAQASLAQRVFTYEGALEGDTQGGYALALASDVVPEKLRARVVARLVASLAKRDGRLTTGVATTTRALVELSRAGVPADTYACDTRFPALGWQLEHGATTTWERRDAFAPDRPELDARSGDLSRLGYTSIGEWLVGWVAGLRPDETKPGWEHFVVAPAPCARVTSARASHATIRGRVEVSWTKQGGAFELDVLVPPNTSATVVLPADGDATLAESGKPIVEAAPFVRVVERAKERAVLEVAAGSYHFRVGS